jgi:hypothetical protein
MKKLILILSLLLSTLAISQNESVFDSEWYEKLDSELEYITFPNPSEGVISIRVYRGSSIEHTVTIRDAVDQVIYTSKFEKDGEIDLTGLSAGVYFISITNDKTELNQKIKIK